MGESSEKSSKKSAEKFKEFLGSRKGEIIVLTLLSVLSLIFTVIFFSIPFTDLWSVKTGRDHLTFWTANDFYTESVRLSGVNKTMRVFGMNIYLSIAFAIGAILIIIAWCLMMFKKKTKLFYVASIYYVVFGLVCLIFGTVLSLMRGGAVACCIFSILFSVIELSYLIARRRITRAANQNEGSVEPDAALTARQKKYKLALLICECVALFVLATVLFIPVYSEGGNGLTYVLINSVGANKYPVYVSIGFIVMIIALFGEILFFISTISDYFGSKTFAMRSRRFVLSTTVFTLIFFILGYCLKFYYNLSGEAGAAPRQAVTVSYIPFMLSVVTMIVYSVFSGKFPVANGEIKHDRRRNPNKLEPLFAILAMTIITFASLAINVIEMNVKIPTAGIDKNLSFTGFELLTKYKDLDSGFQMLAFIEFAFLLMSGILFVLSLISFIARDKSYYKIIKTSAIANLIFVMLIGLFGVYFKIGQKINMESIESMLSYFKIPTDMLGDYEYEVTSKTIYMLLASVAVIIYMISRRMFGLSAESTLASGQVSSAAGHAEEVAKPEAARQTGEFNEPVKADFDACPAFTEIDNLQGKFQAALEKRHQQLFDNLTLPNLVRFVVDYARESRLHLSYTPEDIATFVAGLGASRLTILQGMSGTGKTSLPKIFTEALMSNCEIVEVESSWRDKNELLGYYNEFSKCYTPKKFTQCLYRARLNSEVITFIVLDEMNLSRIEYYFSDFLSLMENEEDRRAIKLLNVKLSRTEKGKQIPYDGLADGHTIKIPTNIWFIGTANRDESTFEISDKVYDRAQTMNFDKRAPKIDSFSAPLEKRFINYDMLAKLFEEAKANYKFDAEENRYIREAEKLLAPYNISFGNRILRQMEAFVKVYCACFGKQAAAENDAVEKILLSKVVRKLENKVVENKEKLATEFDNVGLKVCGAFIRKLNED